MIDFLVLAMALGMDAFAVSISLGAKHRAEYKALIPLVMLYFGLSHSMMSLLGFIASKGIILWISAYTTILAFILLLLVGVHMLYEAVFPSKSNQPQKITHRMMLVLAIATSVDASAAGLSLTVLDVYPLLACIFIGLVTALFSWFGLMIGTRSGTWLENKAEIFGGLVLILLSLKLLIVSL